MLFSLDAYGNYGTAYIDLNNNEFIREADIIYPSEQDLAEQELQNQNIEEREEGSTSRLRDPTIFSRDLNAASN